MNSWSRYHHYVSTHSNSRLGWLAGFFFFAVTAVLIAGTDDEWLMRPWQTEDGLPDNSVNGLKCRRRKAIPIGTPTGLARLTASTSRTFR